MAIDLYRKRKVEALEGKKLPERLRRATVTFAEIARDALTYSKVHKADTSYRCDAGRMEVLLGWFREYPAEAITAQDIERQFQKQEWAPATPNRYRALLSLTYRLAIRNGKVKENPARLVPHRLEDNARIRFLSTDEETALRKSIEEKCSERLPEFDFALNGPSPERAVRFAVGECLPSTTHSHDPTEQEWHHEACPAESGSR
jgi:hypothetical protein